MLMVYWFLEGAGVYLFQAGFLLLCGRLLLPLVIAFLMDHGLNERNYKGMTLPTATGLLVWVLLLINMVLMKLFIFIGGQQLGFHSMVPIAESSDYLLYSFSLSVVTLLGFMDDAVGSKTIAKGFAGHWRLWREQRRVSTGMLKAGGTLLAAIPLVTQTEGQFWTTSLMQVLLLCLMANGINLMDMRPGRALKVFFTLCIGLGLAILSLGTGVYMGAALKLLPFILPVVCGTVVLFGPDLRGKLMLGDTGANLIGFAFGYWVITVGNGWLQGALVVALLLIHGLTWRLSLSSLIERNRLLLWLDTIGRDGTGKI